MAQLINLKELKIYEFVKNREADFIDWLYENEYLQDNSYSDDFIDHEGHYRMLSQLIEDFGEEFYND